MKKLGEYIVKDCIHAYLVDGSNRWPILVCVDKIVDGFGSNNLIEIIMNVLLKDGGLSMQDFSKNILCFGAYDMNVFQGGNRNDKAYQRFMGTFF